MADTTHVWKKYKHATRGLTLTACETCGLTRYTQGYPQASCSGQSVHESKLLKLGYLPATTPQTGGRQTT